MAFDFEKFRQALVAVSTFDTAPKQQIDPKVEAQIRALHGGRLVPLPTASTRWYLEDIETATHAANTGNLTMAAQIWESCRSDGAFSGVLSTRTSGLVRLPKSFKGDPAIVHALESSEGAPRSLFDEMFPPAELTLLVADGIGLGYAFGELIPVAGRTYPVFQRYDPQIVRYRPSDNTWYYKSLAGELPITPGNGRHILHMPGGRVAPWVNGVWKAVGRAHVRKEHAHLYFSNWQGKLANPARIAQSPNSATEEQSEAWWQAAMAWGVNTTIAAKPGYELKLLESNGRGHESFDRAIAMAERDGVIAIAGQAVTVDGGAGFLNMDMFAAIRTDLIQASAMDLAYTINTQGIPQYVATHFGIEALRNTAIVTWDTTSPTEVAARNTAIGTLSASISQANKILADYGQRVDALQLFADRGLRIEPKPEGNAPTAKLELAPTDVAKVVRVREAREAQGLGPLGDDRDDLTVLELAEQAAGGQEPPLLTESIES